MRDTQAKQHAFEFCLMDSLVGTTNLEYPYLGYEKLKLIVIFFF